MLLQPDRLAGRVSSGQGTIRVGSLAYLAVRKFVLGAGRWDTIGTPTLVSNPPEVQVTLQDLDKGGEKEGKGRLGKRPNLAGLLLHQPQLTTTCAVSS